MSRKSHPITEEAGAGERPLPRRRRSSTRQPRIALALGSGSARGWSHIGVIQALAQLGVEPQIVCGTSIGSVVAAAWAVDRLPALEDWVRGLSRLDVAGFFKLNLSLNGFIDMERLQAFLGQTLGTEDLQIEDLPRQFACVATDLESGREIWFSRGALLKAVQASIALPGLFPPLAHDNRWLVDGGLVNPVPISLCRALGADLVIAVNLNGDIVGKHFSQRTFAAEIVPEDEAPQPVGLAEDEEGLRGMAAQVRHTLRAYSSSLFNGASLFGQQRGKPRIPNIFETLAGSVNITQDRITRSRMAGDPPDLLVAPRLAQIGLLEFHRADEAIAEGRACIERVRPLIEDMLG